MKHLQIIDLQQMHIDPQCIDNILSEDYQIFDEIGRGAYGVVFKGIHKKHNIQVAVKVFSHSKQQSIKKYILREIQVMQTLTKLNHPNIMKTYGTFEKNKEIYLILQYCPGRSIAQRKKFEQTEILKIFQQFVNAMIEIHKLNIIHRDIKPANILLDGQGNIKIADFGISRTLAAIMTQSICSPLYAAPEVLDEDYNQKCDVWSGGVLLYYLITGQVILEQIQRKNALKQLKQMKKNNKNPKIKDIPQNYHPFWKQIIEKMVTVDISKRPSYAEVSLLLENKSEQIKKHLKSKIQKDQLQASILSLRISQYLPGESLGEHESICLNRTNQIIKYFQYIFQKTEVRRNFIQVLCQNQSGKLLGNTYKYIMCYLSESLLLKKLKAEVEKIRNKKLRLPGQKQNLQETVSNNNQKQFKQDKILGQKKKMQIKIEQHTKTQKFLIDKLATYLKREKQSSIIKGIEGLLKLLECDIKQQISQQKQYRQCMLKAINHKKVYKCRQQLKDLTSECIKQYLYVRIVGQIDQIFNQNHYLQIDQLKQTKKFMDEGTDEERLAIIFKYN